MEDFNLVYMWFQQDGVIRHTVLYVMIPLRGEFDVAYSYVLEQLIDRWKYASRPQLDYL